MVPERNPDALLVIPGVFWDAKVCPCCGSYFFVKGNTMEERPVPRSNTF